jgi:hypothetical protein
LSVSDWSDWSVSGFEVFGSDFGWLDGAVCSGVD